MAKKNKQNNDKKNYIFSIVVLSIVLCISLVYNFLGGFDFENNITHSISVGDDCNIIFNNIGAQGLAIAIEGTAIPGDTFRQKIQVVLPDLEVENKKLRAKMTINDVYMQFEGFVSWELNPDDNYYYFNDDIYKSQNLGLCSKITLPQDISLNKNVIYYIIVVVELV